jgi:hypothetical protein
VADDEQQRRLEVAKLRLDVLKHITTLSGAAALILLALAQRTEGIRASELWGPQAATPATSFGLAALLALFNMMRLLRILDSSDPIPRNAVRTGTELVAFVCCGGRVQRDEVHLWDSRRATAAGRGGHSCRAHRRVRGVGHLRLLAA